MSTSKSELDQGLEKLVNLFQAFDESIKAQLAGSYIDVNHSRFEELYKDLAEQRRERFIAILKEYLELILQTAVRENLFLSTRELHEKLIKFGQDSIAEKFPIIENLKEFLPESGHGLIGSLFEKTLLENGKKIRELFDPDKKDTYCRTVATNWLEFVGNCTIKWQKDKNYKVDLDTLKDYVSYYYNGNSSLRNQSAAIEKSIKEMIVYLKKKNFLALSADEEARYTKELTAAALTLPDLYGPWCVGPLTGEGHKIEIYESTSALPGMYAIRPSFDPKVTKIELVIPHPDGESKPITKGITAFNYVPRSYIAQGHFRITNLKTGDAEEVPASDYIVKLDSPREDRFQMVKVRPFGQGEYRVTPISDDVKETKAKKIDQDTSDSDYVLEEAQLLLSEQKPRITQLPHYLESLSSVRALPISKTQDFYVQRLKEKIEKLASAMEVSSSPLITISSFPPP